MSNLFLADSESESESDSNSPPVQKLRKLVKKEVIDVSSDSSDWDEVPLENEPQPSPDSFNISINTHVVQDDEKKNRAEKIRQKHVRTSIHYLGMVSNMIHLARRNKLLSDHKVLKTLKKLLPESFLLGPFKKFKKLRASPNPDSSELDTLFIYLLKYLIKWFRLNFKFDSNGLRVLGYLPKDCNANEYYPSPAPTVASIQDLISVIKKFKHNRDVAAQLFTSLLRSLGFEARLVYSLPLLPIFRNKLSKPQPKVNHNKLLTNKDNDLLYPYYWTELINPLNKNEIIILEVSCFHDEDKRLTRLARFCTHNFLKISKDLLHKYYTNHFYPIPTQLNQMTMHTVLAIDNKNIVLDVSSRYMSDVSYRWFNRLDLRTDHGRSALLLQTLIRIFNRNKQYSLDINSELDCLRKVALTNYTVPDSIAAMKRNPNLVSELNLRYNETIKSNTYPIKTIKLGGSNKKIKIYFRNSIVVAKSENQWKFLGRSVMPSEVENPIKVTSAILKRTVQNKRIYEMNLLNNQPELNNTNLYSFEQTCPYIKLQISNDANSTTLPRNKYGNIEIFRNNMIPDECCWLKLSEIEPILQAYKSNKLVTPFTELIQYVPVVVGFSFGSMPVQAIPIKNGILVLKSQEALAKRIWLYGKIQADREKSNLALVGWAEMIARLRIKSRLNNIYGEIY